MEEKERKVKLWEALDEVIGLIETPEEAAICLNNIAGFAEDMEPREPDELWMADKDVIWEMMNITAQTQELIDMYEEDGEE